MLSKEQLEDDPRTRYMKWFWIWERDLLELARGHPAWREKAHELGFTDEAIDRIRDESAPGWKRYWPFPDEGRRLRYMLNPFYRETTSSGNSIRRPRHEREPGGADPGDIGVVEGV